MEVTLHFLASDLKNILKAYQHKLLFSVLKERQYLLHKLISLNLFIFTFKPYCLLKVQAEKWWNIIE